MTPETSSACHLGTLPHELLDSVFFELETVADVARFIRTARFVYHRYEARQRAVLWRVLQTELGPVLVDAQFLNMLPYADPRDQEHYYGYMHRMALAYRDMLKPPQLDSCGRDGGGGGGGGGGGAGGGRGGDAHSASTPSLGELTALCRTLRQVNFLADAYVRTQLGSFQLGGEAVPPPNPSPTTTSPPSSLEAATGPLSPVERQRVLRAFYRRQIVSHAWAPTRRVPNFWVGKDMEAMCGTGEAPDTPLGLMSVFESWENQHIDHANLFIARVCFALLRSSRTSKQTWSLQSAEFHKMYLHQDYLSDYLRANPALTEKALLKLATLPTRPAALHDEISMDRNGDVDVEQDDDESDRMVLECIKPCSLQPLRPTWQHSRSRVFAESRLYLWEREGKEVKYAGDALELPPYAWIDGLEGNFVNWYGEALDVVPRFVLWDGEKNLARQRTNLVWRCAGFALWDRDRVEALKQQEWLKNARTGWVLGV